MFQRARSVVWTTLLRSRYLFWREWGNGEGCWQGKLRKFIMEESDFRGSLLLYIFTTYICSILWSYEQRKSNWALAHCLISFLGIKVLGAPKSLIPPWWTDSQIFAIPRKEIKQCAYCQSERRSIALSLFIAPQYTTYVRSENVQ